MHFTVLAAVLKDSESVWKFISASPGMCELLAFGRGCMFSEGPWSVPTVMSSCLFTRPSARRLFKTQSEQLALFASIYKNAGFLWIYRKIKPWIRFLINKAIFERNMRKCLTKRFLASARTTLQQRHSNVGGTLRHLKELQFPNAGDVTGHRLEACVQFKMWKTNTIAVN